MKLLYEFGGFTLALLVVSCATTQSIPTPLPTLTEVVVLPSATSTVSPTSTFTPIPPTETATPPATPTPTATATRMPTITPTPPAFLLTQDLPPIPVGKGALIVANHYGQDELNLDIGGTIYKIPGSGRMVIYLLPGRYTFSASVGGHAGRSGAFQILENYYLPQDYGQ